METVNVRPTELRKGAQVLADLVSIFFAKAKFWLAALILLQVALYAFSVVSVFSPSIAILLSYPFIAFPLTLLVVGISARVSKCKGTAEFLKRHHEYLEGFGKKPAPSLIADLRDEAGSSLDESKLKLLREGITFLSEEPLGPRRVLENLAESAWFTKRLANTCSYILGTLFVVALCGGIAMLLYSGLSPEQSLVRAAFTRSVAATFTFLLSVGVLRSWIAFASLSNRAGHIHDKAIRLLEAASPDPLEAQGLLAEYQVHRASAPLIPTWLWKVRRQKLNAIWGDTKRNHE